MSQQIGDDPSSVAVVLGETAPGLKPNPIAGVKIDHIDVGSVRAAEIPANALPDDEWQRAFVLAHRWGLDAASPGDAVGRAPRRGHRDRHLPCRFASEPGRDETAICSPSTAGPGPQGR